MLTLALFEILLSKVVHYFQMLEGHTDEVFSCQFNYSGDMLISGSKDNTCRLWKDTNSGKLAGAL